MSKQKISDAEAKIAVKVLEGIMNKTCPYCGSQYQGKQIGKCVHCEHCGYRLYTGKVSK